MENYKKQIKEYFKIKNLTTGTVKYFIKNNKDIEEILKNILIKYPAYQSYYYIITHIINDKNLLICKNCNNYIKASLQKVIQRRNGYHYCDKCNKLPQIKRKIRIQYQDKRIQTTLLKYGVQHTSKLLCVKNKTKATCLKKYGEIAPSKNNDIKQKIKNKCLQKYNVFNFAKIKKLQNIIKWQEYLIPLFDINTYINDNRRDNNIYKWKCLKCGNQFQSNIHKTMHIPEFPDIPRCLICYPYTHGFSNLQLQLINFCKQYYVDLIQNDRSLIKPYQLDIVIPQKRLAIQFNGCFWHSIQNGCQDGYHLRKTQMCQNKGYRLIHIWQDQWQKNNQQIKVKLLDIFNNRQKVDFDKELDRCWYRNQDIEGYVKQILQPDIIQRNGYKCQNCGYIRYRRIN